MGYEIDQKELKALPDAMAEVTIPVMLKNIKDQIKNFIPQNTSSLIREIYIDREHLTAIIGVGSLIDDEVNRVAIKQHEESLNHFGSPGGSMLEGLTDSRIKWIQGHRVVNSKDIEEQDILYWEGYEEKKKNGQLNRYKAEYLKKATEQASSNILKGIK